MTFSEKLKSARKAAGMSQELFAEKLGVSRQAVTKWETDREIPELENMILIARLFGLTVDELLSLERAAVCKDYLYESRTEYDVDGKKRFDLKLGGARQLRVVGTSCEKMTIRLASDDFPALDADFKVKIDDVKGRIDAEIRRRNGRTQASAKESLALEVFLPNRYLSRVELEADCDELCFQNMQCENLDFHGKAKRVFADATEAALALDCSVDMDVRVKDFSGSLEINQLSSTSRLTVPDNFAFQSLVKGLSSSVSYEMNGLVAEDFSSPDADNIVELNGLKSELVIVKEGAQG